MVVSKKLGGERITGRIQILFNFFRNILLNFNHFPGRVLTDLSFLAI